MSDKKCEKLNIIDNKNYTLFDNTKYKIPIYQRAFAWESKEIEQLLNDIKDFDDESYYLGSLIVKKVDTNSNTYDVIDGQQRLTALYLILSFIYHNKKLNIINNLNNPLTFECRQDSNDLLKDTAKALSLLDKNELNCNYNSIIEGYKIIKQYFEKEWIIHENKVADINEKINHIILKLKNTCLFRIEVPEHTDLNRYFEVMNTRGEQLEQHEILKANLMSYLSNKNERTLFAKIWDACSNMDGYVQMHFDTNIRTLIFGKDYQQTPFIENDFSAIAQQKGDTNNEKSSENTSDDDSFKIDIKTIIELINNGEKDENYNNLINITNKVKENKNNKDKEDKKTLKSFESIISFPYFLLHVLKVYIINEQSQTEELLKDFIMLDDLKLQKTFKNKIEKITSNNEQNKRNFAINFIIYLLKCRFLFDNFIIKRQFDNDNSNWSLIRFCTYDKKPNYENPTFKKDNILMLQSCLRVTYTSPKSMHWITILLDYLYKHFETINLNDTNNIVNDFQNLIEQFAKDNVKEWIDNNNFSQGVATPHIVFNYLDYVIWELLPNTTNCNYKELENQLEKINYKDFKFEYRNSVEHWYPQNPKNGKKWKDEEFNMFGNLCILGRIDNANFSNFDPSAKKAQFKEDKIKTASLKLQIMSNLTENKWDTTNVENHQNKMINLLKNKINNSNSDDITIKGYYNITKLLLIAKDNSIKKN